MFYYSGLGSILLLELVGLRFIWRFTLLLLASINQLYGTNCTDGDCNTGFPILKMKKVADSMSQNVFL